MILDGDNYRMVRVPVRDFDSLNKFAVIFPAPDGFGLGTQAIVTTVHSTEPLVSNAVIGGFPARVEVVDNLTYAVTGDFLGDHALSVYGSVGIIVSIDIGSTIVTISNFINAKNPANGQPFLTNLDIGQTANAVPFAQWGRYVDLQKAINAADTWIDYVRIVAL